jgi:predicted flavoprotein YhiN
MLSAGGCASLGMGAAGAGHRRAASATSGSGIEATDRALVAVNQRRIALTELQAQSTSTAWLRSFTSSRKSADAARGENGIFLLAPMRGAGRAGMLFK